MSEQSWAAADEYFASRLVPRDESLTAAVAANKAAGLPAIDVSLLQGKLLHVLARSISAKRILEIGTLGGFSTIWLARALAPGGKVITLELEPHHAAVAEENLQRAGVRESVEIRVGPAVDSLAQLVAESQGPFDFIFIDADKASNPDYISWALLLSRPGTMIFTDNIARGGAVIDAESDDPSIQGTRRFFDIVANEPRLCATAIQTVGTKGHDGFALALVIDPEES